MEIYQMVYTASKDSYGTGFFEVCNTLDELKRAIVKHYLNPFDDNDEVYIEKDYTEELFKDVCKKGQYHLAKVKLHPTEKVKFGEYDGASGFSIEKKDPPAILSSYEFIN